MTRPHRMHHALLHRRRCSMRRGTGSFRLFRYSLLYGEYQFQILTFTENSHCTSSELLGGFLCPIGASMRSLKKALAVDTVVGLLTPSRGGGTVLLTPMLLSYLGDHIVFTEWKEHPE